MANEMEINVRPIFATPLLVFRIPDHERINKDLRSAILTREANRPAEADHEVVGWASPPRTDNACCSRDGSRIPSASIQATRRGSASRSIWTLSLRSFRIGVSPRPRQPEAEAGADIVSQNPKDRRTTSTDTRANRMNRLMSISRLTDTIPKCTWRKYL